MTTTDPYNQLLGLYVLAIKALRVDTTYRAVGAAPPAEVREAAAYGRQAAKSLALKLEIEQTHRRVLAQRAAEAAARLR